MTSARYAIHHVGGRWGNVPFPRLPHFSRDLISVIYEADVDAIDSMSAHRSPTDPEILIIPTCLAASAGERTLHLTFNPGGTSLLEPKMPVKGLYNCMRGVDFDLDAGMEIIGRRKVLADTLDNTISTAGCPAPDFLSLDTQGTEYDILCGGEKALNGACGLIVEVEFVELYRGQKRFQDVHDFLNERGFSFARFEVLGELRGPRHPIGFRGRGRQIWADALFLRRPETATEPSQLIKLAFTCFVFGHVEFGFECLAHVDLDKIQPPLTEISYVGFLREAKDAYHKSEAVFPPVWSEILSRDRAAAFSAAPADRWYELFDLQKFSSGDFLDAIDRLGKEKETPFEQILRRYGLNEVAACVAEMRLEQATKVKDAIMITQGLER